MTQGHRVGMDHELYAYSPIWNRPRLELDGRSIAVYLVLQLEHWELAAPEGSHRDPRFVGEFGTYSPEYRHWTTRAYGNRVGVYRILDLLDSMGIAPTAAVGAALVQTHPELLKEITRRGWEVAAHGFTANRMITSRMDEARERAFIAGCRDILADALGSAPQGWLGQDFGATWRTPSLLKELGFTYTLDWSNDDLPFWLRAGSDEHGLVSVPAPSELDDVQTMGLRRLPPHRFPELVKDMLDGMSEASSPRVLALGVHPWMFGAPHRIRYLREALEVVQRRPDVLVTTAGDIARRFLHTPHEKVHHA